MKKWWLFFLVFLVGFTLPEPTGYVVDNAKIISSQVFSQLEQICKSVEPNAQIAILTISSTQPYSIEQYSIKLAEKWKVGYAGKDNGVILIVAKDDRKVRIEIGRGVEDKITDAKAGRIIQNNIVPFFKQGNYSEGILNGTNAIKEALK